MATGPMTNVTRTKLWLNFLRPSLAYVCACLTAGFIVSLEDLLDDLRFERLALNGQTIIDFIAEIFNFGGLVFIYALIPSVILLMISKLARIYRGVAEFVFGALLGFALTFLLPYRDSSTVVVFVVAGALAGLTYWLAAGRPRATRVVE